MAIKNNKWIKTGLKVRLIGLIEWFRMALRQLKNAINRSHYSTASSNIPTRRATPAERKAQLAKLAELGVAVPEDYRREVAIARD